MTVRMTQIARRPAPYERGAILVLALAFLAAFGLIMAVLLNQVGANLQTTTVVRSRSERSYAADGAIEQGIQLLSVDPTKCTQSTGEELSPTTLNGRPVTLSCKVVGDAGFPVGAAGWAAIVRGNLDKQAGGEARINGPVYVQGTISISGADVVDEGGSVFQGNPGCPAIQPGGLTVEPDPPYRWQCASPTQTPPDPAHVLPPVPTTTNPLPGSAPGGCTVFYPGRYTTPPVLGNKNYFVSGTYYFDFPDANSEWTANGSTVGGYNPADPAPSAACVANPALTDATRGGGGSGYGVQWIFGGRSHIKLGNKESILLHTRVPGPDAPAATRGISVQTVVGSVAGYRTTNLSIPLIDSSGGQPAFRSFGLIYAPNADVALLGPVGASLVPNGVVSKDLLIKLSNGSPDAFLIGLGTSASGRRFVELTATAISSGEAEVISRAVVEIRNATNPPEIVVQSWRTTSGADTG